MKVRIFRKWHKPEVKVKLQQQHETGLIEVDLEDILMEMKRRLEIGLKDSLSNLIPSVTWIFSNRTYKRRVDEAVETIMRGNMFENIYDNIVVILETEFNKTDDE